MKPQFIRGQLSQFTLRNFQVLPEAQNLLNKLHNAIIKQSKLVDLDLPGLAIYIRTAFYPSNVVYVDVMSLPADSKDTLLIALKNLHANFIVKLFKWLVVVGDAKIYTILQNLKRENGSHMQRLLSFPGDWHILYNYQRFCLKYMVMLDLFS